MGVLAEASADYANPGMGHIRPRSHYRRLTTPPENCCQGDWLWTLTQTNAIRVASRQKKYWKLAQLRRLIRVSTVTEAQRAFHEEYGDRRQPKPPCAHGGKHDPSDLFQLPDAPARP